MRPGSRRLHLRLQLKVVLRVFSLMRVNIFNEPGPGVNNMLILAVF
jgi:hypothetical protein